MSIYDLGAIMVCGVVGYFIVAKILRIKCRNTKVEADNSTHNTNANYQSNTSDKNAQIHNVDDNWHKILGVSSVATIGEIKAAYQKLMSQYHPDKVATLGTEIREVAERRTKEVNAAYQYIVAKYGEHFFKT